MTKRHFEMFARYIQEIAAETPVDTRQSMANMVIWIASDVNPRFDRERFLRACNLPTD